MEKRRDVKTDTDYSLVSEIPGIRVTREAASMLYTRYTFASSFCKGKDVLELGCGAGIGLGYMARHARRLVGGDYTESMLRAAKHSDVRHVPLIRLDAQRLPFKDSCFDVVLLFEAIYYLPKPQDFLLECRRILRETGTLLLCTANKEWAGFSPSALSHSYFSASELRQLLAENQFDCEIYGAFQASANTPSAKLVNFIRVFAVKLDLIPQTMRGKEFLKQFFYGELVTLGSDIQEDIGDYCIPEPIPSGEMKASQYKVIYAMGRPRAKTPVDQLNFVSPIEQAESQAP